MVEIDILTECKQTNIVGLYEAFFFDSALWVSVCVCSCTIYGVCLCVCVCVCVCTRACVSVCV